MYEVGKDIMPELRLKEAKAELKKEKLNKIKNASLAIFLLSLVILGGDYKIENIIEFEEEQKQELVNSYIQEEVNKNMKEQLLQDKTNDRLAFYIQNSGIKKDGSISKPSFFGMIPDEYKTIIIDIKDRQPNILKTLLSRKIDPNNKVIFEAEMQHPELRNPNPTITNNLFYQRQR